MVSRFELHAYGLRDDLVAALRTDELTAASDVFGSDVATVRDSKYVKNSYPINNGVYALMNTAQGLFADKNLRQAIELSLDRDSIRMAAGDNVPALDLPFIPSQVRTAKLPTAPRIDLKKAELLLKKSKWTKKDGQWQKGGQPLAFSITTTKNDQYERVANEIASQLRPLGMQVTITVIDDRMPNSNFVGDVLQRRNFQMLIYELQIGGDPDVYAYWHSSQVGNTGYNFTSYDNDTADAALISARDRTDKKLRDAKYALFARQWLNDAPAIGLYQQVFVYVHKPSASAMPADAHYVSPSDRYGSSRTWTVNKQTVYKTP
jgi:peptide/nickel transport system substrate-binding protein